MVRKCCFTSAAYTKANGGFFAMMTIVMVGPPSLCQAPGWLGLLSGGSPLQLSLGHAVRLYLHDQLGLFSSFMKPPPEPGLQVVELLPAPGGPENRDPVHAVGGAQSHQQ